MKLHLVSVRFDCESCINIAAEKKAIYFFTGLVTAGLQDGRYVVSISKIFKNSLGFDMPLYTQFSFI